MSEPEEEEGIEGQAQNERVNRQGPRPTDDPAAADVQAQNERVNRQRPRPTDEPGAADVLVFGFLGASDRPGYVRLYRNRALTRYREFRREDAQLETVPRGEPPIPEEDITCARLRPGARVEDVRSRRLDEHDEFEIDVDISPTAGTDWGATGPFTDSVWQQYPTVQPISWCHGRYY